MFEAVNAGKTDYTSLHRYQVVLEATFTKNGNNLDDLYARDRKSNPRTKMYTLNPEDFVLSALFTPDPQHPALSSFKGTVFRGHLERGGQPIDALKDVIVNVKKVVHARKFDPSDEKPRNLEYFLFGKGQELFLAHLVTKPPDFDQILSVKIGDPPFTDEELDRGVRIVILDRKNSPSQRIKEKEKVTGQGHITGAHQFLQLQIQAGVEFYFEEGELLVPAKFKQTKEERKAGF